MGGERPASVLVHNVPPTTTELELREFFAFCGQISGVQLRGCSKPREENDPDSIEAVVTFDTSGACRTAMLLSNGLLGDRLIAVESMEEEGGGAADEAAAASGSHSEARKPSVFSNLLADAFIAVKKFDDQNRVSVSFQNINRQHKISEHWSGFTSKAAEFGERIKLKDHVAAAQLKAKEAAEKAMENQRVARVWNTIAYHSQSLSNTIASVKAETKEIIAEKQLIHQGVDEETAHVLAGDLKNIRKHQQEEETFQTYVLTDDEECDCLCLEKVDEPAQGSAAQEENAKEEKPEEKESDFAIEGET